MSTSFTRGENPLRADKLNTAFSERVLRSGDTMQGMLRLAADPAAPFDAATKQYVDRISVVSHDTYGGIIDGRDYGVVADGVTDSTAQLASAIAAAQATVSGGQCSRLMLPKGRILTGPQTITAEIFIQGVHSNGTVLVLKNGSTAACITINPSGAAFPAGVPAGHIELQDLRIENQSTKSGSASAHGIEFVHGAWTSRVTLDRVTIHGMPGDGVHALSFDGYGGFYDCSIYNNLGTGANINSCSDWHWYGGDVAVNGTNVVLSGCVAFVFEGTNIYSGQVNNLYLFSSSANGWHSFTDCFFDRALQHGVVYDMRSTAGATFKSCGFILCSSATPNTYSDVSVTAAANNLAMFIGCYWGDNYANAPATYPEKWNIEFQGAGNSVTLDGTNTFVGAALRASAPGQVTNSRGGFVVGAAALATTATSGFLYIPTCAGTPTGVPTAYTGRVPMVFDTTGNKFWLYNGGWKGVVVA